MVLQQVGGVNSIAFYATIFILAGRKIPSSFFFLFCSFLFQPTVDKEFGSWIEEYFVYDRVFGSVGTVAMVVVQVLDSFHVIPTVGSA